MSNARGPDLDDVDELDDDELYEEAMAKPDTWPDEGEKLKAACAAIGWAPPLGPRAHVPEQWRWAVPKEEARKELEPVRPVAELEQLGRPVHPETARLRRVADGLEEPRPMPKE